MFQTLESLLIDGGVAYTVTRKIPVEGKIGLRKRIQNYVVLTLPSIYRDDEMEIYRMVKGAKFEDKTVEIEDFLANH